MSYLHKLVRLFRVDKLVQLFQPKNYKCATTTVLYDTARILNNIPDSFAITIGAHTHIRGELMTFGHGGRITIGEYCYVGDQSYIWSAENITIGNRVLIAHNVNIFDNITHPLSASARHEHFKMIISAPLPKKLKLSEQPITIEDDAWIGCLSISLKGVTIGRGAVIGAGSVVTKDVPPYTIVAGNPAKVIREIPLNER
jgi:acetyltransferase-like isoleucine patch superfamily enzyme